MSGEHKNPRRELERVLTAVAGEPLVILLSGHPDPDSIGSALAHQHICASLGVEATIAHVLPVSHADNRALVKLLNVEMTQVSSGEELADFKYLSLVDTSMPESSIDLPEHLELLTVVDHHRGGAKTTAPFVDVRLSLGASCTMYAQYLEEGLAPLTVGQPEDMRVATGLLFGIRTDTDHFVLATPDDFAAAAYARTYADINVVRRAGRGTVSAAAMTVLGRALTNLTVVRDFALAGVGLVPLAQRDAIGSAADHILLREDIDTVLVYGVVEDRIDGSLRTNSPTIDPASFLQTAFGADGDGKPYGGGRMDKGGFQIPIGFLALSDDSDALWRLVRQRVRDRLQKVVPDLAPKVDNQHGST